MHTIISSRSKAVCQHTALPLEHRILTHWGLQPPWLIDIKSWASDRPHTRGTAQTFQIWELKLYRPLWEDRPRENSPVRGTSSSAPGRSCCLERESVWSMDLQWLTDLYSRRGWVIKDLEGTGFENYCQGRNMWLDLPEWAQHVGTAGSHVSGHHRGLMW